MALTELGWGVREERDVPWSEPARLLLAGLLVAAGAIHLVMAPSHADEWLAEGIGFALAGWTQIVLAGLIVARPSAAILRISCLVNAAFVAIWVVSRVAGLPFGPEAGEAHEAAFVDVLCTSFEAIAVLLGYELLARPSFGSHLPRPARAVLGIAPVAALVLATVAITSPGALEHGHTHSDAEGVAAGHTHGDGAGAEADAAGAGHSHGGAAGAVTEDDKGLSLLMNGQGEGGGHTHDTSVVKLDPATQDLLDEQLDHTKPFIRKYPTVADATAAGYTRQGPYSPGLGAHYGGPGLGASMDGGVALDQPTLIYDGIEPDSKLAGFMYNIFSMDTKNPPEGFIGPNDHWHYHTNVCIVARPGGGIDAPLGADTSAPKELCDKYGGNLIANTGYMVHVWTVPGYESPQGLFSNLNAKLTCPNGTYWTVSMEEIGNRSNVCRDVSA